MKLIGEIIRDSLVLPIFLFFISPLHAQSIKTVTLTPAIDMQRADLAWLETSWKPSAVLVLCPGMNGDGANMVGERRWQEFAQQHQLGLMGISFTSSSQLYTQNRGYFAASKGSGEILLKGVRQIYGDDLPLLLFGMSAGAVFTISFEEWKPERVISWCADAPGYAEPPKKSENSFPGVVVCGDEDSNLGTSLIYFKQGRAEGKPWLWLILPHKGHARSPVFEDFVCQYFAKILDHPQQTDLTSGMWIDIDQGNPVDVTSEHPALTGWLPDAGLLQLWKKICIPESN